MPATGNLAAPFDPIPIPEAPRDLQTQVEPGRNLEPPPQYQNYQGSWGGVAASYADKFLTGWMAGKKIAEDKKRNDAAQKLGTLRSSVDQAGQAYRKAYELGDQAEIERTGKILTQQWAEYNQAKEAYVFPEQQIDPKTGKPKGGGIKGGLKRAFVPHGPELFVRAAVEHDKQFDIRKSYEPGKQERQEATLRDWEMEDRKNARDAHTRWQKVSQTAPDQRTKDDQQFMQMYEYEYFHKSPGEQLRDDLWAKVLGGQQLNKQEHDAAVNLGMLRPDVVKTTMWTKMGPGGKPQTVLISLDPDSKIVNSQPMPGTDYVPPNQAQVAGEVIDSSVNRLVAYAKKAYPGWAKTGADGKPDDAKYYQFALSTIQPYAAGVRDWDSEAARQAATAEALEQLMKPHLREVKGEGGISAPTPDAFYSTVMGTIIQRDPRTGELGFLAELGVKPESHWFNEDTYRGMTKQQLIDGERQIHGQFRALFRAAMKKRYPRITDEQVDSMMPKMIMGPQFQGAAPGLTPTPGEQATSGAGAGAGGPITATFQTPDGGRYTTQTTQQYIDEARNNGVRVVIH